MQKVRLLEALLFSFVPLSRRVVENVAVPSTSLAHRISSADAGTWDSLEKH